jgi:uncharacterized SAM-binding protein YcdF (DUF218 family)
MADAIICLGSKYTKRGERIMRLRAAKAAELWREKKAKYIVCTGGRLNRKRPSEASFLASVLVEEGVPASAIILENQSTTTIGNAYYSLFIIRRRKWKSILLVTDVIHMPRAHYLFSSVLEGVMVSSEPCTAPVKGWKAVGRYMHEWGALLWIIIRGIHFTKL